MRDYTKICTIEEFAVEQLHGDDSEDELEEDVHDEDVEDVLEGVNNAVEHCLQFGHSLNGFEGPENPEHPQGLDGAQLLTRAAAPV